LQIEIVITLAVALIVSAEGRQCNEKDVNSQTLKEGSTLEHVSSEKGDTLYEKEQETNELAEKEENILEHMGKIIEFEGHQEDGEPGKTNQEQQLQDEENRKKQHAGKEKHLQVGMKQTQGEAEASKLQHDAKEINKEENDGEQKEKKHGNREEGTPEQAKNLSSVGKHSDQQTAQNNGLEIRQRDEHVEHPSEGYRVTEPEQDEEHQFVSQSGFNYLFGDHGGHNLQHGSNIFEGTSLHKHHHAQTITLADKGSLQQHFPVYIQDEKHEPHPAGKPVSFPFRQLVTRPATIPQTVHKHLSYSVKVPYFLPFPVEKRVQLRLPVSQKYTVHIPKSYAVLVEKKVPTPYAVRAEVPQPYVNVPVDRPVPVPVAEHHPLPVQQQVHSPAEKNLPYPVKVRIASFK
jgi:hypothetical protein